MFFALKGPNFDGNQFAEQALAAGASYAVVDDPKYNGKDRFIVVADVLTQLQDLAAYHRRQLKIPIIAITGSNGKTTSKELVYAVLKTKFKAYATEGNLNNHIGVPLTLLKIQRDAEIAIIEMGANHQKEIESYCKIAQPDYGIITNCGKAHIEGFGGIEGVRKGKGELYDFVRAHDGGIFRNADLDYLSDMSIGISKQITYGSGNAQYSGKILKDQHLMLKVRIESPYEITVQTHLVGDYNFPNVMLAIAVGDHFGVNSRSVKDAIEGYMPDNSRSQLLTLRNNTVILDAYNANPTSMRAAIDNFAGTVEGKRVVWLGAMKEMGADQDKEHRELRAYLAQFHWDQIVLVGAEFENFAMPGDLWFPDSERASAYLKQRPQQNATILIKGSRGSKMERLLDALK